MSDRSIEIKVGLLVIVSGVLFAMFIIALGDIHFDEERYYFVEFRSASGLTSGAPVKIAGVTSGKVREVRYMGPKEGVSDRGAPLISVKIGIQVTKADSVRENARFHITATGVLGAKYIEIDPGTGDKAAMAEGASVRGEEPFRLEIMTSKVDRLVSSMNELMDGSSEKVDSMLNAAEDTMEVMRSLIADNAEALKRSVGRIDRITENTLGIVESVNGAIGDGEKLKNIFDNTDKTLANAKSISAQVRKRTKKLISKVHDTMDTLNESVHYFKEVAEQAKEHAMKAIQNAALVLEDAHAISQDLRAGKGLIGGVLQDPELFDELKEMMRDLKRHPWKFLWKE